MMSLIIVSSIDEATAARAAVDAGLLPGPRVLLVVNEAEIPEITPGVADDPTLGGLEGLVEAVVDVNAAIAPLHPRSLRPGSAAAAVVRDRIAAAARFTDEDRIVLLGEPPVVAAVVAAELPHLGVGAVEVESGQAREKAVDGALLDSALRRRGTPELAARMARLASSAGNVARALWFSARL